MELTVGQALRKGIEAHKAGNAVEADRFYTGRWLRNVFEAPCNTGSS